MVSKPGMALEAARKAQAEGLVRHICFSSHDATENIIKLIDTGEFAGMLVQYNYLDRHNEPAIAAAHQHGMGVVDHGPGRRRAAGRPPAGVVDRQRRPAGSQNPRAGAALRVEQPQRQRGAFGHEHDGADRRELRRRRAAWKR